MVNELQPTCRMACFFWNEGKSSCNFNTNTSTIFTYKPFKAATQEIKSADSPLYFFGGSLISI